jgi:MFS transporter, OFA family, oxalate/formate antiporter
MRLARDAKRERLATEQMEGPLAAIEINQAAEASSSVRARRWIPVAGGVLMNMALGTFYANSTFLPALEKEFGWTRAQTSLVTTFGIVMIASWFVVGGRLYDRKGPRITGFIGGILFSLGFFLASHVHSLLQFYLTVGVCVGAGNGFGYVVPAAVGSKWFPDKRGLIVGLMIGGYGAGSAVFGPLATSLIDRVGWRTMFQILAVIFFVMTMLATYLMKDPPARYRPANWSPSRTGALSHGVELDASEMIRTRTFWALWIAYALGTTAGTMVISQLVPFARAAGHTAAFAIFILTALGNAGGRLFSGWISDHAGRLNTLRVVLFISAVAMPALFLLRSSALIYPLLFVVYYCYGTQFSVYATTSADFWGTRNFGVNYGILLLAWGFAGILGPLLGGRVYVATGEYRWAFFIAAAVALLAVGALFLANQRRAEVQPVEALVS